MRFHVLSDELDDADKRLLEGIASRRENTEVAFYSPAKLLSKETLAKIDATLQNRKDLARPTYYRLLIADLLPADIRRALYIDGDVVCTGSLEPLFALDLHGCPVGACAATLQSRMWVYNLLGYPPEEGYYGSGVLLLDLDRWRSEGLTEAMLGCLKRDAGKLFCHDQTLINAVLHGRIFPLDYSYNMGAGCYNVFYWLDEKESGRFARETQYLPKSEWPSLRAACESPRLVHFYLRPKPWHRECDHPFAPVWRYFCSMSPWKGERLNPLPARARIRRLGRRALERVGLIAPASPPYPQEALGIARRVLCELQTGDSGSQ